MAAASVMTGVGLGTLGKRQPRQSAFPTMRLGQFLNEVLSTDALLGPSTTPPRQMHPLALDLITKQKLDGPDAHASASASAGAGLQRPRSALTSRKTPSVLDIRIPSIEARRATYRLFLDKISDRLAASYQRFERPSNHSQRC
ncbi:hypothetical protein S7711_10360 [Stachybotrys chartarum IBT 7711]|uniref:Uncharacterized protein n=1 Tax=Stachybotrys chartarum (strain CBS 109288 / IBT 7711) TaxID=1280523 RepID=A0A084B9J2_STACB|nr:hypothetical protein S7711_10360 [Stachybotrys chartarum IBT 7711]KFA55557.1 hypothetical protein S40293_10570 [Stachybotrys chartarum IBT 40293]KFA71527.1 hypothetical protein S40288_11407 [Stachybotrys chartarum IBT 40288]